MRVRSWNVNFLEKILDYEGQKWVFLTFLTEKAFIKFKIFRNFTVQISRNPFRR